MRDIFLIALAGALGTVSRYLLGLQIQRWAGGRFPYWTLTVNVLGCFFLTFLMVLSLGGVTWLGKSTRVALTTGFMGAFTTFSTFGYESARLLESDGIRLAGLNVLANLILGFIAVWAGWIAAQALLTR